MSKDFSKRIRTKHYVDDNGCWVWTGARKAGYGIVEETESGAQLKAHRLMYAHTYGPIPPWLIVIHDCMNKRCINPSHLKLGTRFENARYPDKAKLSWDDIEKIRADNRTAKEIAKDYGVYFHHIYKIKRKEIWT